MAVSVSTMPRTCVTCRNIFQPRSNRQKYCSACGRREAKTCEICGKLFQLHSMATGRWCSEHCAGIGRRSPATRPRPCEHCEREFLPRRAKGRFCSKDCAGAAMRRPVKVCPVCAAEYDSKHKSKTCSKSCAGILRRQTPEGSTCERCGARMPWSYTKHRFCSAACRKTPVGALSPASEGYVRIMTPDGWQQHHRYVMAQTLGRPLDPHERVHHKNGDRADNRPENLELWKVRTKDPSGVRASDYHCPGCRCGEPMN